MALTKDDLMQECLLHLLERERSYDPTKSPLLTWVFFKSIRFFQSHFRNLTRRRGLRVEHSHDNKPSKKGRVSAGVVNDSSRVAPDPDDDHGDYQDLETLEIAMFRELQVTIDPIPEYQQRLDLQEAIESLPPQLRQVIDLMLEGVDGDTIAWKLRIHPTMVSAKKQEAIKWLSQRMKRN